MNWNLELILDGENPKSWSKTTVVQPQIEKESAREKKRAINE